MCARERRRSYYHPSRHEMERVAEEEGRFAILLRFSLCHEGRGVSHLVKAPHLPPHPHSPQGPVEEEEEEEEEEPVVCNLPHLFRPFPVLKGVERVLCCVWKRVGRDKRKGRERERKRSAKNKKGGGGGREVEEPPFSHFSPSGERPKANSPW